MEAVWALQRLKGMVLSHLRLGSKKQIGSRAVMSRSSSGLQSAARLAREWGATEAMIRQAIADAVESSPHKNSPEATILRRAFSLV
jgi:hypothetical protein